MKIHPMWHEYPTLAPELASALTLIEKQITTNNTPVAKAIMEMINGGGKLLRPAYCLLFSRFQDTDREKMIALAAAIETLHTATLIHDDIIDKSPTRRNQVTIQKQFGPDTAVYAGDYLFVVCFKLLAHYASSLRSIQQDSGSMEKILKGELDQMATRYQTQITINDYLKQVSGKTGQLFALSCFVGAYESGGTTNFAKTAEKIGMNIGIAFQLLDDILDYTSDGETLGKPVYEDVRSGVYSAPLILAMQRDRQAFLPLLAKKEHISDTEMIQLRDLVIKYEGAKQAYTMAQQRTDLATAGLQKLPAGAARDDLIRLTESLLNRKS
ncbi:polyprenyl synthetase family protein [Lacticaseibacillus rhamnosus]|uniref:polyprenyl synthetase family protein n=1 Tax=Lacticaseibacillus rhamnosus TaxID=47715 RepID=UPI0008A63C0B|nr:polyprenyl synthetase family protein [Lacticaseibacillus rhamnosus]OFN07321.1 heptaprenyl diphosphate synthase [Lactobacillus sp. HMSC072E07]MBS4972405.1 polyprenyl synthetase family protein [Lacticaseibacillus rhamnosus]MDK7183131.1 polyprenyl synthetase family protein [Lacticaseibacillus rhamnosus]MDK7240616.1 polyprenyl synthetase family protein [Lacticaseibacillus rhamnosus]MDT8865402.1 polyprenyl synthetase family protein [Lacticaseibacillus rhamnosus]